MTHGAPPPKIITLRSADISSEAARSDCIRIKPRSNVARAAKVETRPCFASSWVEEVGLDDRDVITRYQVSGVGVSIAAPHSSSCGMYIVDPPEYKLSPLQLQALAEAIAAVTDRMPGDLHVNSLATVRPYIKAKGKDFLYSKLAAKTGAGALGKDLDREADRLADVLCKYTAGYGILETLLEDKLIQDIYIDSPSGQTPVQVVLRSDAVQGVRQKCRTNVFIGRRDLLGFVSRVKFETGLPFSEAHPVLEADMKRLGARVTLVSPPLSDKGISLAVRKHSRGIWTMPMLIGNGSLSPLLASFLWACVIGRRTVLVAGSRGAGKTTLLGAMMLEFPKSQRIVLIEDTPEISVDRMQSLGFDIQSLRFDGSGERGSASAQEALRVSLRMGESAIVIGEVRGQEAQVLYESMRAGSAGSSVLGTIHGNSAKGVLDRAVEDLGVTERAFSSTDIVVVIGLVRSPDGTRFSRRVIEVAEVRRDTQGVLLTGLFETEQGCTCAKPTTEFTAQCKTVSGIADALGMRPEAIIEVIKTRAHADQLASELSDKRNGPWSVGADEWRVRSNEVLTRAMFHPSGPEAGLREWRSWVDANEGQ
jgi:type IV secretory pathway ATPase VirB11/archaellum biosynthesis ATPase